MDKVRLAIVGCGTISQLNAPGYLRHERCEVVALCDPMPERAERRAKEWGISPRIYTTLEQVLNDPNVDAVELLTPTHMHADQSIAVLEAGKHLSCQKPMATSMADADRVATAAKRAKTQYRVTENFLSYPPLVKAKELMDAGAIGEPTLVRMRTIWGSPVPSDTFPMDAGALDWRRDARANPGGLLYDDGWHKYATAIWLMGDVAQITSMVTKTADFMIDAPSAAIWRFENGRLGVFEYTHAPDMQIRSRYYPNDEFFEIQGTAGSIWVTRCTGEMLDMPPVMLVKGSETASFQVPMDWKEGFDGAAVEFVDCLLEGRQANMDADFSWKTLRAALAIYESSELQRPVSPRRQPPKPAGNSAAPDSPTNT